MTNERNIFYVKKTNDYIVTVQRFGKIFRQFTNSLEEAIELRDRVEAFITKHNRILSKKELNIKRRVNRNKKVLKPCICVECGKSHQYKRPKLRQLFADRGHVCGQCIAKERRRKEFLSSTKSESNEKYISIVQSDSGDVVYRLSIVKNGDYFIKSYSTLEQAKKDRSTIIEFYQRNYRLPNDEEREKLFGFKRHKRRYRLDNSEISNKSNTVVKNVSYSETTRNYNIQISRDRKRFHAVRVDFEEAVALRNAVISFYKEFDRLPSIVEATKYMKGELVNAVD